MFGRGSAPDPTRDFTLPRFPGLSVKLMADSRGRRQGRLPPIDRKHLKTSENFARKCIIFA